jgi:hypothetical protein
MLLQLAIKLFHPDAVCDLLEDAHAVALHRGLRLLCVNRRHQCRGLHIRLILLGLRVEARGVLAREVTTLAPSVMAM